MNAMLKLVIDNSKKQVNPAEVTCRTSCDLFDELTETCSISQNVNVDSSYEAARCGFFLSRDIMASPPLNNNHIGFKFSLIEEEADYLLDDPNVFHELIGKPVQKEKYTYPNEPDFPAQREDARWYVSSCGTYGCWIVNLCKKPLLHPKSLENAVKGWTSKVYKSPIPLHDHKSSLTLASKVAWIIDAEGYGQYGLLINGQISSISSPKPVNWTK